MQVRTDIGGLFIFFYGTFNGLQFTCVKLPHSDCIVAKEKSLKSPNPGFWQLNGGSSSIKFALYQIDEPLKQGLYGKVDRIGLSVQPLLLTT